MASEVGTSALADMVLQPLLILRASYSHSETARSSRSLSATLPGYKGIRSIFLDDGEVVRPGGIHPTMSHSTCAIIPVLLDG